MSKELQFVDVLDTHLDAIEKRLNGIDNKITDMVVITTKNTIILEEHQRRSLALENCVEAHKKEGHPITLKACLAYVAIIVGICASIATIYKGLN